jgi:GNAT superfamily N-acetyltransferase
MDLQIEPIVQVYPQLDALLQDYFMRTIASEGLPPLRMNWLAYSNLCQSGNLILMTARENHTLLGFVMYHIYPHLHHIGVINAACDILAVGVDHRGKGIGRKLMAEAEPVLRARGVRFITHQHRTDYDVEPLFPKLGYRLIEQGYLKELS